MALESHEFPSVQPYGAIAFVLPKNWDTIRAIASLKNRKQAFAFQGQDRMALVTVRMFHPAASMSVALISVTWAGRWRSRRVLDDGRPARDKRHRDASFMRKMFVEPKRRGADVCPGNAVAFPDVNGTGKNGMIVIARDTVVHRASGWEHHTIQA